MAFEFDDIIASVLRFEGGYVHDPQDPGGETKYGISKRAYPKIDIKALTMARARTIYKNDYWTRGRADKLPGDLRHHHFDMCVNAGIKAAVKVLQKAANRKGCGLKIDGIIGPKTIKASESLTANDLAAERLRYYVNICRRKKHLRKFLYAWCWRVSEC